MTKSSSSGSSINSANGGVGVPGAVSRGAEKMRQIELDRAASVLDLDAARGTLGEAAGKLSMAQLVELQGGPIIDPASKAEQARFNNFAAGRPIDSPVGIRELTGPQIPQKG